MANCCFTGTWSCALSNGPGHLQQSCPALATGYGQQRPPNTSLSRTGCNVWARCFRRRYGRPLATATPVSDHLASPMCRHMTSTFMCRPPESNGRTLCRRHLPATSRIYASRPFQGNLCADGQDARRCLRARRQASPSPRRTSRDCNIMRTRRFFYVARAPANSAD